VARTDQLGAVFGFDASVGGGTFTDFTAQANAGADWTPWPTPEAGDQIYFIHSDIMWTVLALTLTTGATGQGIWVWEFYDGEFQDIQPSTVTDIGGGQLEFNINSVLGTENRSGATVRITLNETGAFEDVISTFNGSENIATTGLLGQTVPSADESDYAAGYDWTELAIAGINLVDGSIGVGAGPLSESGDLEYDLPQSEILNWRSTTINGFTGFPLRLRIVTPGASTSPVMNLSRLDTGDQFAITQNTQGRAVEDNPLGSSTGDANQRFETTRDHFILFSETVTVDGETWISVTDFLNSTSQDKHYRVELGENDRATIAFGDGVAGRIPPVGVGNITIDYRFNAENDGNVGANTIAVDKTGLTFVNSVFNPRQASGWAEAQGASEESLELAKIEGPASLRVKEVALSPDDLVTLAIAFIADDGSSPFTRAKPIEEGFGPKTVKLITVASGGAQPSPTQLTELDLFFNGDRFATPPIPKHFTANQEVTSVAFDSKAIDVVATVEVPVVAGLTAQQVVNRLTQILQPEAVKEDGVTFEWEFGADVPASRIIHEIFETDEAIQKVTVTTPATDVVLSANELPTAGTFTITIVEI
jgi:hypothetical protein